MTRREADVANHEYFSWLRGKFKVSSGQICLENKPPFSTDRIASHACRLAGADAVIELRERSSSISLETRVYHVTATAIRYTDPP